MRGNEERGRRKRRKCGVRGNEGKGRRKRRRLRRNKTNQDLHFSVPHTACPGVSPSRLNK